MVPVLPWRRSTQAHDLIPRLRDRQAANPECQSNDWQAESRRQFCCAAAVHGCSPAGGGNGTGQTVRAWKASPTSGDTRARPSEVPPGCDRRWSWAACILWRNALVFAPVARLSWWLRGCAAAHAKHLPPLTTLRRREEQTPDVLPPSLLLCSPGILPRRGHC